MLVQALLLNYIHTSSPSEGRECRSSASHYTRGLPPAPPRPAPGPHAAAFMSLIRQNQSHKGFQFETPGMCPGPWGSGRSLA